MKNDQPNLETAPSTRRTIISVEELLTQEAQEALNLALQQMHDRRVRAAGHIKTDQTRIDTVQSPDQYE